jgi:tRNA G10  N-methylase Trm11
MSVKIQPDLLFMLGGIVGLIANPKLPINAADSAKERIFAYYAGFSTAFVRSALDFFSLKPSSLVLDPWNGSGTTTTSSYRYGLKSVGGDLNPAMVVVAKANLISFNDVPSLVPLGLSILETMAEVVYLEEEPLLNWFHPQSAAIIRAVEHRINQMLVCHDGYVRLDSQGGIDSLSPLAAFFYVALFRTVRRWTAGFSTSNPTWIRIAKASAERKRFSRKSFDRVFMQEVQALAEALPVHRELAGKRSQRVSLLLSNSVSLPLAPSSVDAVITSPPYCTRIDYAVATFVELSILRIGGARFDELRRGLTGTATVGQIEPAIDKAWGRECERFLKAVYEHPSKASKGYYFKSHVQYFSAMHRSLYEISRVLRQGAPCALVVQNSYYKEVRNDVATIVHEMAEGAKLRLTHRADFLAARTMVHLNSKAKEYLPNRATVESALFFERT